MIPQLVIEAIARFARDGHIFSLTSTGKTRRQKMIFAGDVIDVVDSAFGSHQRSIPVDVASFLPAFADLLLRPDHLFSPDIQRRH